eukprot:TRINITY_DN49137_c0_g1_i1.p1 TRINITY_DN49137_c0_g1~~TRINITY_DN49137_c0_g1_i1.p1  ORF type:complete len:403 (-),score=58.19 TRINITY_DN49137_c0_g1_i1:88-1173(-)
MMDGLDQTSFQDKMQRQRQLALKRQRVQGGAFVVSRQDAPPTPSARQGVGTGYFGQGNAAPSPCADRHRQHAEREGPSPVLLGSWTPESTSSPQPSFLKLKTGPATPRQVVGSGAAGESCQGVKMGQARKVGFGGADVTFDAGPVRQAAEAGAVIGNDAISEAGRMQKPQESWLDAPINPGDMGVEAARRGGLRTWRPWKMLNRTPFFAEETHVSAFNVGDDSDSVAANARSGTPYDMEEVWSPGNGTQARCSPEAQGLVPGAISIATSSSHARTSGTARDTLDRPRGQQVDECWDLPNFGGPASRPPSAGSQDGNNAQRRSGGFFGLRLFRGSGVGGVNGSNVQADPVEQFTGSIVPSPH